MPCFGNDAFSKSNKKEQRITRIGIQESILHLSNNATIFENNLVGPLNINVEPSLPFRPLHFLFSHSFQVAPRV
jgi:hypothetical protein